MKKIKFMMPALAIASTAAAITPMVTSCNKAGVSVEGNAITKGKLNAFKPDIEPLKKTPYKTDGDLMKAGADAVYAEPKGFLTDILYAGSNDLSNNFTKEELSLLGTINISVTNFKVTKKFEYLGKSQESTGGEYYRECGVLVDMTIGFNAENMIMHIDGEDIKVNKETTLKIHSLPFSPYVFSDDSKTGIGHGLDYEQWTAFADFSMEYKEKTINAKDQSIITDFQLYGNNHDSISYVLQAMDGYLSTLLDDNDDFKSYYFQNAYVKA